MSDESPGTPAKRGRGRPRDPETDTKIIHAAAELLLLRGFDKTTVDEVAARAGVGKATVYRRWARKEDLAVAAMEQLYRDEMPPPDTGSIRGDLAATFTALLTFVNSPAGADYVRTTIKESMRDERIAALYRSATLRAQEHSAEIYQRAIERGEVRADVPKQTAVEFLGGLVISRAVMGLPFPSVDEVQELVDFVMRGIQA